MGSSKETQPNRGTTVILFGPQILSFKEESLEELRMTLSNGTSLHWILEAVEDLPRCWNTITQNFPKLSALPGENLLADLNDWLKNGRYKTQGDFNLPNLVLTPLVVITQLAQYWRFLKLNHKVDAENGDLQASIIQRNTETLGFCTGLLSAFAVSCSSDEHGLKRYGAAVIRLAMLIGAIVDAQDASDDVRGRAISYTLAWASEEQGAEMRRIIDEYPEVCLPYDKLLEAHEIRGHRLTFIHPRHMYQFNTMKEELLSPHQSAQPQ